MIRPSKRLIALLSIMFFYMIVIESMRLELNFVIMLIGVPSAMLGLLLLIDLALIWQIKLGNARRDLEHTLSIGSPSKVTLIIQNPNRQKLDLIIFDHIPNYCSFTGLPTVVSANPNEWIYFDYEVTPFRRGQLSFGKIQVRAISFFSLLQRSFKLGEEQVVNVYPNFARLSKEGLKGVDIQRAGNLKRRRRGQGMDFDQLREYREGDTLRQIDWKATARNGKLISKEYQDERDQRIIMLVDCGRRLGAHEKDDNLSHFDHVLDSALLLTYVGLHHGDSVGMQTMGGYQRFLAPQRSKSMLNKILNLSFDLQPTLLATDYEVAAQELSARERKRALVVIFTNLRDEDDENLITATRILSRRHLVLVANLREPELNVLTAHEVKDTEDAAILSSAIEYKQARDSVFAQLRANGVLCLDVEPKELGVKTINTYLDIKASGRL